jgi:hypothetical protein
VRIPRAHFRMMTTPSNARSLAALAERVAALGKLILRGDIERWITSIDAAGTARRAELAAAFTPPMSELLDIVSDFGGVLTLQAIEQVRLRVWREHHGLAGKQVSS